jgi:acid phosphatase (class A)
MPRLRRRIAGVLILLVVTAVAASATTATHAGYYYLDPRKIDLTVLLPPPPDLGSAEARSDEEQVASAISSRSVAQVTEAQEGSQRSVFFYARSVGPNFTPARLPVTAKFFERIGSDVAHLINSAKAYWARPRPGGGGGKKRGSYPSGHAAFASSSAIVLGLLLPARREAIFSQARVFAENRILLGLHYPTDIASGWTAGTLAAFVMMHDAAFRREFAQAEAELRRAHLVTTAQGR